MIHGYLHSQNQQESMPIVKSQFNPRFSKDFRHGNTLKIVSIYSVVIVVLNIVAFIQHSHPSSRN